MGIINRVLEFLGIKKKAKPEDAAGMAIRHVKESLELTKKYNVLIEEYMRLQPKKPTTEQSIEFNAGFSMLEENLKKERMAMEQRHAAERAARH